MKNVVVRLFSPDADSGKIRVKKSDPQMTPIPPAITTLTFNFDEIAPAVPLTIGQRVIRADYDDGNKKSAPAYLMLRPGQNYRTLVITVP
jgi:hypothetical protein